MSYYTTLINAWNGATQPPTGVTGTALTGSMTTAQKLAAVNAWTVTGVVPTTMYATGVQVANCVNWTEFASLTAAQQLNLLTLLNQPGLLLGGSANTANLLVGMLLAYFTNHSGPTITALTALAQATVTPWWQANGYTSPFTATDLALAGNLT
jgi:hypothetical protein